jgi:hypothetical protein
MCVEELNLSNEAVIEKKVLNLQKDILKSHQGRNEKRNYYMMVILKIYIAVC